MADAEKELSDFKAKTTVWKENVKQKLSGLEKERNDYKEEAERHVLAIEGYKEMIKHFEEEVLKRADGVDAKVANAKAEAAEKEAFYKEYLAKQDEVIQQQTLQLENITKGVLADAVENEVERTRKRCELHEMEKRESKMTISTLTLELAAWKRKADGTPVDAQREQLFTENLKLKQEVDAIERHMVEQQQLYKELAIKENHLQDLYTAAKKDAADAAAKIDFLKGKAREKVDEKEAEIASLKERFGVFKARVTERAQQDAGRIAALEAQVDGGATAPPPASSGEPGSVEELQAKLVDADERLEKMQRWKEMVKAKFDAVNARNSELEEQLKAGGMSAAPAPSGVAPAGAEEELRATIEEMKVKEAKWKEMIKAKFDALEASKKAVEDELAAARDAAAPSGNGAAEAETAQQVAETEAAVAERTVCESLQSTVAELQAENAVLIDKLSGLDAVATLTGDLARAQQDLSLAQEQITSASADADAQRARADTVQAEHDASAAAREALEAKLLELRASLAQEGDSAQRQLADAQRELADTQSQLAEKASAHEAATQELAALAQEKAVACGALEAQLAELRAAEQLAAMRASMEEEGGALQQQLADAREALGTAEEKCGSLEVELASKAAACESAEEELAAVRADAEEKASAFAEFEEAKARELDEKEASHGEWKEKCKERFESMQEKMKALKDEVKEKGVACEQVMGEKDALEAQLAELRGTTCSRRETLCSSSYRRRSKS
eukprot:TRINITY_DN1425_c0_g1_i1.p1 TRINITY_DN1425_c0_g1~~TRINITY_DN1425_c0_g1_i1.p1  ORF type:complete len:757 (+),score=370.30 TRINITY_DN1425_c0_g1_i1:60-2273(+)